MTGCAGREPEPSAAVIDSQSPRAAGTVAAADHGYDGGKRPNGTKRHVAADVLGLLLTVQVHLARSGLVPGRTLQLRGREHLAAHQHVAA